VVQWLCRYEMRLHGYASREIYGYGASDFVVRGVWTLGGRLLFSHPMPLGIEYWFLASLILVIGH